MAYQTFEGRPLIRGGQGETVNNSEVIHVNHRYPNAGRLVCFAIILTIVALLAMGPLTFVVAIIRLKIFPAQGSDPPAAPGLATPPPTFRSQRKTFSLQLTPTRVQYPEAGDKCAYHVYTYGGTMPGPAIYAEPGMTFNVEVSNTLGPDLLNTTKLDNEYRFANTTTTHYHGLHVSPGGKSDNVYLEINPEQAFTYTLTLRPDHPSGTYFIHPHLHGSTALQTGFAASSPLIVRDQDAWWRSLPEEVLMIQRGGLGSGHTSSDAQLAFAQNDGPTQKAEAKCEPSEFTLINGVIGGSEVICDDIIRRWRIINSATDGGLVLRFKSDKGCRARLVARDGIYLSEGVPKVVRPSDVFVVPPGGRIDFLVQQESISEVCELVSEPQAKVAAALGPKTKVIVSPIAKCIRPQNETNLSAEQKASLGTFPTTLPALPAYMDDLRKYPKAERRTLEWTEFTSTFKGSGNAKYGINGEPFVYFSRFSVRLDRIQEWVIINALAGDGGPATEAHPFHLHTNHFQIISSSGNALSNEDYVAGQWRDTVYVPTPGNLTIRWIPRHFTGQSLLHCKRKYEDPLKTVTNADVSTRK